jgi:hypothetical protein
LSRIASIRAAAVSGRYDNAEVRRAGADAAGPSHRFRTDVIMNKGLIWTIVGILLIIALIIWITRAV